MSKSTCLRTKRERGLIELKYVRKFFLDSVHSKKMYNGFKATTMGCGEDHLHNVGIKLGKKFVTTDLVVYYGP